MIPSSRRVETANDLRRRIESGEWEVGGRLPSSPVLMSEYGTTQSELSGSRQILIQEGYLLTVKGRHGGTFVASLTGKSQTQIGLDRIGEIRSQIKVITSTLSLLEKELIEADPNRSSEGTYNQ